MITVKKNFNIDDINDSNLYVKEELKKGILIFGEENNGFFNKEHKRDLKIVNNVLQEFIFDLLKNNKIYYMASGLYFDYSNLNNIITPKEEFLKNDCLISQILNYDDITKALNIWTESCNENRVFIVTDKDILLENITNDLNASNLLIVMSPDYFGYGFFVTYNENYDIEKMVLSILEKYDNVMM